MRAEWKIGPLVEEEGEEAVVIAVLNRVPEVDLVAVVVAKCLKFSHMSTYMPLSLVYLE